MVKKYFKKIIAQSPQDLQVISACCEGGKIKIDEIKYLPKNKIFLFLVERIAREKGNSKEKVKSIVKFEYIEKSKSKNIDSTNIDSFVELTAINLFKNNNQINDIEEEKILEILKKIKYSNHISVFSYLLSSYGY